MDSNKKIKLVNRQPLPRVSKSLDMLMGQVIRRSYFGTGSRIHAMLILENGNYRPACIENSHGWNWKEEDFINDDVTAVNCLRCLKKLGAISGYAGIDRRELFDNPQAAAVAWKARALRAEAVLRRLGIDLDECEEASE